MRNFGFDALPHLFGKTGFQDVLLLHLRGIAGAEVAEAAEVRRRDLWAEGNHLQCVFEVEVGNGPVDQCLEAFEAGAGCRGWSLVHRPWVQPKPSALLWADRPLNRLLSRASRSRSAPKWGAISTPAFCMACIAAASSAEPVSLLK